MTFFISRVHRDDLELACESVRSHSDDNDTGPWLTPGGADP
jgi:hypothetical protein